MVYSVVQLVRRLTDPQGVVAEYVGYPVVSADVNPLENGGWQALGIYAAVAVAILALACLLCIRRRSELSGDVAAFRGCGRCCATAWAAWAVWRWA